MAEVGQRIAEAEMFALLESPAEIAFLECFAGLEVFCADRWMFYVPPSDGPMCSPPGLELFNVALRPQVRIATPTGNYRLDFLFGLVLKSGGRAARISPPDAFDQLHSPLAVEIDGFSFHDRDQGAFEHDRLRDRSLLALGIRTVRFSAREVFRNSGEAALQALETLYSMRPAFSVYFDRETPSIPLWFEKLDMIRSEADA